jgi:hypothetical protein
MNLMMILMILMRDLDNSCHDYEYENIDQIIDENVSLQYFDHLIFDLMILIVYHDYIEYEHQLVDNLVILMLFHSLYLFIYLFSTIQSIHPIIASSSAFFGIVRSKKGWFIGRVI